MTKLTIIISYYKALNNLQLIFKALNNQSCMDFEVILSEDDNNLNTISYIDSIKGKLNFPIQHIYQKLDDGFRKNAMLNRAIGEANTDKIVFIDGDCIPHRHFAKQYIKNIDERSYCTGKSVLLSCNKTELLKTKQSLTGLNFFSLLISASKKIKEGIYFPLFPLTISTKNKGLSGRNWACHRKTLLEINGFDLDYIHAGVGEDSDIEWRLLKHGIRKKSVKNKAIVYHLYHERWYSVESERLNFYLMKQKMNQNHVQCLRGIKTIGNEEFSKPKN